MKSAFLPLLSLILLNSCSWYKDLQRSLVDDDAKKSARSKSVPREQYDQLLVKYEELTKKYQALKEGKPEPSLVDEVQKKSSENFSNTSGTVETVDVFGQPDPAPAQNLPIDLESQLSLFRKGVSLRTSNPGEATKIFQQLESQGDPAVKVRAKLQIGELLLGKGQYDLSLQVFEDIINNHAHSGVVLDALKYAVICSDKLGIQNKKEQYSSVLKDVFEAN